LINNTSHFYKKLLISFIIPVKRDFRVIQCISELQKYILIESLNAEIIICGDFEALDLSEDVHFIKIAPADKGACIRRGVLDSKGDLIVVCDADLPVLLDNITNLLEHLLYADISLGSRYLPESKFIVMPPLHRRLISKIFQFLLRILFEEINLDTQCGIKTFRRSAALIIFTNQVSTSLVYDVQIILRALHHKMKITEVPVHWKSLPTSTINLWTGLPLAIIELLRLWRIHRFDNREM
jgi:hypothetical protein